MARELLPPDDARWRTVHVASVGAGVDADALRSLFGACGAVTGVRLAGDAALAARFAFVEFADARRARVNEERS